MREDTTKGNLQQAYPIINPRGAFGINMNLMLSSQDSFLAFGGHLFNRSSDAPKIVNDPALLMFDTNDNIENTYSSEAIEKLKTKETNYEYQQLYSKSALEPQFKESILVPSLSRTDLETRGLKTKISQSRCFGKKTCPVQEKTKTESSLLYAQMSVLSILLFVINY